jgi:hypothetical protein
MAMNVSKPVKGSKTVRSSVVRLHNASLEKTIEAVARAKRAGTPVKLVGQSRQMKVRAP